MGDGMRSVVAQTARRARQNDARVLQCFLGGEELWAAEVQAEAGLRSHGTYACLQRLEARGALSSRMVPWPTEQGGTSVRRYYRATEQAPAILEDLRAQAQGDTT